MKWFYLLVCSDDFVEHEEIKSFLNLLNVQEDVERWMLLFDKTFLLSSKLTGVRLGTLLLEFVRKNTGLKTPPGNYFITEVSGDRQGWVAKAAWDWLNKAVTYDEEGRPALPVPEEDDEIPF